MESSIGASPACGPSLPRPTRRDKGAHLILLASDTGLPTMSLMPRTARAARGGYCYHVLNRGNRRAQVFHGDYAAFARLLRQAAAPAPMRLLAWCLIRH